MNALALITATVEPLADSDDRSTLRVASAVQKATGHTRIAGNKRLYFELGGGPNWIKAILYTAMSADQVSSISVTLAGCIEVYSWAGESVTKYCARLRAAIQEFKSLVARYQHVQALEVAIRESSVLRSLVCDKPHPSAIALVTATVEPDFDASGWSGFLRRLQAQDLVPRRPLNPSSQEPYYKNIVFKEGMNLFCTIGYTDRQEGGDFLFRMLGVEVETPVGLKSPDPKLIPAVRAVLRAVGHRDLPALMRAWRDLAGIKSMIMGHVDENQQRQCLDRLPDSVIQEVHRRYP